jgi:hypothetical protein
MTESRKVIAGPAGHWYALWTDWQFGETLVGLPMLADESADAPPLHPSEIPNPWTDGGWYEITDPAPECDDAAIRAELRGEGVTGAS